ncbi:c-type cytochrome [Pseudomonas oryzae]|uniref:Cytochrome C oxidase, cbb3-type, subunit III n=1 Tax=Pseudomonas oryzae TaxID=1392877 RepID=A0A1H1RVW1_9PSED|nr:cytochrome c [Pseudomonas oryzae]SDS39119.1 Cytochrome C oxidase, cbb3-type, subunit III [Pseudomonas oryzae]
MKRTITTLTLASLAASVVGAGVIWSGLINVGADDPHLESVHALLSAARERSIAVRAAGIPVPDLNDPELIRRGAGNYHSMCIGCHLAPGMAATELSQNLYPAPPNLAQIGANGSPSTAFWIIKHGIKATGMPAWGKSMGDEHIWGMVAFLQRLPNLDATQYRQLVAASDGHSHGGGETDMHDHSQQHGQTAAGDALQPPAASHHGGEHAHGHSGEVSKAAGPKQENKSVHIHADGKEHVHH